MGNGVSQNVKHLSVWAITGIMAIGTAVSTSGYAASKTAQIKAEHLPGELIVKLRDSKGIHATAFSTLNKALGNMGILNVRQFKTDKSLHVVKLAKDGDVESAIARLSAEPSVEYAEPNFVIRALDLPNDPEFGKLWGLKNNGQADSVGQVGSVNSDINVMPLWAQGFKGSRNVVVAVIDTGVDFNHPDLKDNIYTNPKEIADNGIDDDGNGFIDDVHGWNFAAKNKNSRDDHGHGSHCAGTIGGVGNNGTGVAGVNWEVSIMPIKFLDANGSGSLEAAVESINYATKMGVHLMSNSWGGGGFSQTLYDAIKASRDAGIIFVAAAGNESNNNDGSATYPAGYQLENVIAVAATDNKDAIANFSNYGSKTVHVAAPGVRIYSTVKDGGYDTYSGTSMACPHVAGISALLLSANPTWTFADIKERLIKTSDPVAGLKKKVVAKGRVNAYNAFHGIVPPSTDPDESKWIDLPMVVESDHPYKDKQNLTFKVSQPGAKFIRIHFEKVEVENKYDTIAIEGNGTVIETITGAMTNYTTDYFTGDTLTIRLKSDSSVNGYGFKVDKIQYIPN